MKRSLTRAALIGVATASITLMPCAGLADDAAQPDMQEMMQQWMKYGAPGEHHKHLEPIIGEWNAHVRFWNWMDMDAPPEESTGVMKNTWVLGGRFVQHEFEGEAMGMPFQGIGFFGYDNVKEKYVGIWMDSMMTSIHVSHGTCDSVGKVFTLRGEVDDVMTGETVKVREVFRIESKDRHTMEWHETRDGRELKTMIITYTRR